MTTLLGHLSGLQDASEVATSAFARAQLVLASTVRRNGIAAVHGPPGNGKTFAVRHFLTHNPACLQRPTHWLDMPPNPAAKEVARRLLTDLDIPHSSRDPEYELTELLVPALSNRVVVIDEAQNLKKNALQQVRYLHDRGNASWALVLVGSTINAALGAAPELSSRLAGRAAFDRMDDVALLRALHAWHPLASTLDPELVLQVNSTYGYGNWRRWAQLLSALLDILAAQPAGTVPDQRHIEAALALVQGPSA